MYNVSAFMWYLNEYNRHNISIYMQGFTNPTLTLRRIQDGRQRWPQNESFQPKFRNGNNQNCFLDTFGILNMLVKKKKTFFGGWWSDFSPLLLCYIIITITMHIIQ